MSNMYIFIKVTEISTQVVFPPVPNHDTLILAAGSGNINLVRCLIEQFNFKLKMAQIDSIKNNQHFIRNNNIKSLTFLFISILCSLCPFQFNLDFFANRS